MTPEEARKLAYAFLADWGVEIPNTPHALIYNRMSARQREIFSWIGTIDPDFAGECAVAALSGGDVNLNTLEDLEAGPYPIEAIQVIRVEDPGTSAFPVGTRVRIVRGDDYRQVPPRATLRSNILRDVEGDLAEVASVKIWYVRRPKPISVEGVGTIELPEPWHDLISLDVARFILTRGPGEYGPVLEKLNALEEQRMASLEAHIRSSYQALEARFG